ncbi:MAG: FtsX-like permease family protein [Myxococcota bacterium]
MLLLRLALREIRNHPRFSLFFTLNLALGFAGFVALDAFESSVSRALEARSQAFLGADVAVNGSRPFSDAEVEELDAAAGEGASIARAVVLFSMAGNGERARLVELRAIDTAFPLYGEIALDDGSLGSAPDVRGAFRDAPGAWIDPPLLAQLGLAPGDGLRIGQETFLVQAVIGRDGGRASSGFSIAPRVYIDLGSLDATGLVATGSRLDFQRLYRLPPGRDASAVAQSMRFALEDPRTNARSHDEATQDLARSYGAVTRYLGLVALVAIFLAGLGAAHLFRAHLTRRVRDLAILVSLGATRARAQAIFLAQLCLLGGFAALLASALGAALLPLLTAIVADAMPIGFAPSVGLRSVFVVTALATVGSSLACLPLIARLRRLRASELFAEQATPSLAASPRDAWWWLPAAAAFWALACWRAQSLFVGTAFSGAFAASAITFGLLGLVALTLLGNLPPRRNLSWRLAIRELARGRVRAISSFVSLALCALLVSVVPQMRAVLDRDLETPQGTQLPGLFLFDIQPDQRDALRSHVAGEGTELQRLSPMIRARLDRINGESVRAAPGEARPPGLRANRDAETEARRLRARRYNLTYREALTDSERMVEGRRFSGAFDLTGDRPPEMSLEADFAERLGVGLGDTLTFDVQGVSVEGEVVNLREVRWNSLQPNFFVLFQPGVLEEAPSVFLASVPKLEPERLDALQASIQNAFPNVSSIDVTRAVARMLGLIDQLQWALAGSAWLSLAVGWLLVTSLARDAARARRWETNLLKVLGAELPAIRRALDVEFGLLGFCAGLIGAGLSVIVAGAFSTWVVEVPWAPEWRSLLLPCVGIPLICIWSARAAARGVLQERPLALLQAAEAT